ncbi:MAG: hypothetical protein M3O22_06990 [Pseudomonadota bacterium]|nr:hypothetical protein [Pseudomonadota bacterium]
MSLVSEEAKTAFMAVCRHDRWQGTGKIIREALCFPEMRQNMEALRELVQILSGQQMNTDTAPYVIREVLDAAEKIIGAGNTLQLMKVERDGHADYPLIRRTLQDSPAGRRKGSSEVCSGRWQPVRET